MKKRILFLSSAALLITLMIAGCGQNTAPETAGTDTESRQTVTVSTVQIASTVSEGDDGQSVPAETENETLEEGNVVVEYPQIRDLDGAAQQKQINEIMQKDAKACMDGALQETEGTGVVENTVIYHGSTMSVVSTGTVTKKDGGQQVVVYTTNVDLQTGKRASTGVRENAAAAARKILDGEAMLLDADDERKEDQEGYLQKLGEKKLAKLLERCDFTEEDTTPKSFSYYVAEDEDEIGVYLPVPEKMGSYALLLLKGLS